MSTTIKITDLTELTTPDSNTLNTVFVVVDKSSGIFTTKQLTLANLDIAIDNVASFAFNTANSAYDMANSANILAQAGFNAANTAQADATGAFARANTANITADAAFAQANTTNNTAEAAFAFANTINVTAESAYAWANIINISVDSAYAFANSVNIKVDSAFAFSNTVNVYVDSAYAFANTINIKTDAAFSQANTAYNQANAANVLAQAAFDAANVANAGVVQSSFDTANAAFNQANTGTTIAQSSYDFANTVNTTLYLTIADETAAFTQANAANILAQASFNQANTSNVVGQSAFAQANSANVLAQVSFNQANSANILAQAAFDNSNNAFTRANSANILAQAAFDYANTVSVLGNEFILNTANNANGAFIHANAAFNQSNTGVITAALAFNTSNTAQVIAVAGFNQANAANVLAQAAFNRANTGNAIAQGAFDLANTAFTFTQASFAKANSANVLAQAAFDEANTFSILAQASFNTANNAANVSSLASNTATLALVETNQNTIRVQRVDNHANGAYDVANTALATAAIAINFDNNANAAFDKANSANVLAQAAFDFANTIVSDTQIDPIARTHANAAFDKANSANIIADAAFVQANAANVLAQAAFDNSNTKVTFNNTFVLEANDSVTIAYTDGSTSESVFSAEQGLASITVIDSGTSGAKLQLNLSNVAIDNGQGSNPIDLTVSGNVIANGNISTPRLIVDGDNFGGGLEIDTNFFPRISTYDTLSLGSRSFNTSLTANAFGTAKTWNFQETGVLSVPGKIENIDSLKLDTSAGISVSEGEIAWNSSDGTIDIGLAYGDVVLQVGQETHYVVRNATGNTILNGTAVYCSGVTGGSGRIEINKMESTLDPILFLGLATQDINNGVNGVVTYFGYVRGLDTRGTANTALSVGDEDWQVGDKLYVHPTAPGKLTNVEPEAPNVKICVASVINRNQTAGVLFVRPTTNLTLSKLSDVQIDTPQANELLQYVSANNRWENTSDISANNLVITETTSLTKTVEVFSSIANANSVVTHDCSTGQIFNHTSIDDNFTANFTNLNLDSGKATTITLVLNQGGTAYIANAVQIQASAQTIKWSANTEPTGNVNAVDVVSFSIFNNSGTYIVLGQLSTFG
jgi:hypothetical protein